MSIQWRYFPLHPETPEEGQRLDNLFAGTGVDVKASAHRMKALTSAEGLPFDPMRQMTFNSRKAQELAKWADGKFESAALHRNFYQAYFVREENLADFDVLMSIVQESGLGIEEARLVLQTRQFSAAIDEDWDYARSMGVTGIPTFICEGYGLVGAQPYGELLRLMDK